MSATTTESRRVSRRSKRNDQQPTAAASPPVKHFAPPPKMRRRPFLIAVSIAAVALGALTSVWAYSSTSNTHDVLAVRETVLRGDTIDAEDLVAVKIGVDPALHPLPASQLRQVVGKKAAMDMPAGGVVTQEQITSSAVPPKGQSVVGVSLTAAMLPAGTLTVGDPVRVITTPGQQGEISNDAPDTIDAVVVGISSDATTGNTTVNLQVPSPAAPDLAARAAPGMVAVVLDSRER